MENRETPIREWQANFAAGAYEPEDTRTQISAGWYDWFCRDTSLKNKTYKMGKVIAKVKSGGKVDVDNCYVWLKNNCPLNGTLYDDFRFARIEDGEVQLTIQIDCCWNKHKYCVFGRKEPHGEFLKEVLFESNTVKELGDWLNSPWED